jgi:hypothetical protein
VSDQKYHSFPLSALTFGKDADDRAHGILQYSLVETGDRICADKDGTELQEEVDRRDKGDLPDDYYRSREHNCYVLGCKFFGLNKGSAEWSRRRHTELSDFIEKNECKFGRAPIVRIAHDYLWQVISGRGMSYREFSVLCGIYAIIGNKQYPVRITNDRIRAAAMGYSSNKVLFLPASEGALAGTLTKEGAAILEARSDKAKPLTLDQIRYTIENLEKDGHFARVKPNRREVYYSHRIVREEMIDRIFKMKTSRNKLQKNRQSDAELAAKIKAAQGKNGTFPSQSHLSPNIGPSGVPSGVPSLIKSSLIKSSELKIKEHTSLALCVSDSERKKASEEFGKAAWDAIAQKDQ